VLVLGGFGEEEVMGVMAPPNFSASTSDA
jgi:hypothetical protein